MIPAPRLSELERARHIQRSFLPRVPTRVGCFRLMAEYLPAEHVGGDFYDVTVRQGGRELVLSIGDVSGKGLCAALWMARIQMELRRLSHVARRPRVLLDRLQDAFAAAMGDDMFVAIACVVLDARAGRLWVANAGHVMPLVRDVAGEVRPIGEPSGPPIGVLGAARYDEEEHPVEGGELVVLATDGVTDELRGDGDPLGLVELARRVAAAQDLGDVGASVLRPGRAGDDRTLVVLQVDGLPRVVRLGSGADPLRMDEGASPVAPRLATSRAAAGQASTAPSSCRMRAVAPQMVRPSSG